MSNTQALQFCSVNKAQSWIFFFLVYREACRDTVCLLRYAKEMVNCNEIAQGRFTAKEFGNAMKHLSISVQTYQTLVLEFHLCKGFISSDLEITRWLRLKELLKIIWSNQLWPNRVIQIGWPQPCPFGFWISVFFNCRMDNWIVRAAHGVMVLFCGGHQEINLLMKDIKTTS